MSAKKAQNQSSLPPFGQYVPDQSSLNKHSSTKTKCQIQFNYLRCNLKNEKKANVSKAKKK